MTGSERATLDAFLDYHRATLALKCEGLSDEQWRTCSAAPSNLSLLGLVRHMAEVERHWFRRVLNGEDAEPLYYSREHPDGDFELLDQADPAEALATWQAECAHSRTLAAAADLDATGTHREREHSLRWILVHMIEEYARHNGHADLIRERIDGVVGE